MVCCDGDAALQTFEILSGVVKTIGMVDAQAIHLPGRYQTQDETVGCLKHRFVLHANTRQIVGIEKTAVVDVISADPPVGKAESLALDELMELFEACGVGRSPIDHV